MSWSANHIYATPTPAVIDALCAAEPLRHGLYLVDDFSGHDWPELVTPYELPREGLLVAREIEAGERRLTRWTNGEVISWRGLEGPESMKVLPPAMVVPETYISRLTAPPTTFLRFLKYISLETSTTVAYYHHDTSGGETSEEFAWVFGGEDAVYVYYGENTVFLQTPTHKEVVEGHGVLPLILWHFGVMLPQRYFPPHTQSFPWDRYRFSCDSR